MKETNPGDAKANGSVTGPPASSGARKRSSRAAPAGETQKLAGLVDVETQAIDAQMWPVHALIWLQPDLMPAAPPSSGLRVERRYKVPAPDYLVAPAVPAGGSHRPEQSAQPLPPDLGRGIPASGLSPLGWDPRAIGIADRKCST